MPHPPEKVWRALTQSPLIGEWLMKNDFEPVVGHRFRFTADWGGVDGEVMVVEPNRTLAYTWGAFGVGTVVTWTLTPSDAGTHLRMEHAGFAQSQEQAYKGATYGWPGFLSKLEKVLESLE
jgi:uncharacterized protein YndB with AHSA1/START domain